MPERLGGFGVPDFATLRQSYQSLSKEEKDKNRQYARERYRSLSEYEKRKKRQYGHERYKNLLEDEYRKHFSRMREMWTIRV